MFYDSSVFSAVLTNMSYSDNKNEVETVTCLLMYNIFRLQRRMEKKITSRLPVAEYL